MIPGLQADTRQTVQQIIATQPAASSSDDGQDEPLPTLQTTKQPCLETRLPANTMSRGNINSGQLMAQQEQHENYENEDKIWQHSDRFLQQLTLPT